MYGSLTDKSGTAHALCGIRTALTQAPHRVRRHLSVVGAGLALGLAACTSGGGESSSNPAPTGDFEITTGAIGTLVEGSDDALFIPVTLTRSNGYTGAVSLRVEGASVDDVADLTSRSARDTLTPDNDSGGVLLNLAIGDLPLLPHSRSLTLIASDGIDEDRLPFELSVQPVNSPDIYLLVGQSNMVGSSGDGSRDSGTGGPDESDPRVKQLNVTYNDQAGIFANADAFTDITSNVRDPAIVVAEDPLHVPRGTDGVDGAAKSADYIGLGLTFGKQAAAHTTQDVILVPAAWSGSAFCDYDGGPVGQWNAAAVTSQVLGNTLLFDRAVTRANAAIQETGGVLRGILWHQGESDSTEDCAPLYADNLERLISGLRESVAVDRRGAALRQADANIPVVVGTMSRGGDFAVFGGSKAIVDQAHRNAASALAHVAVSNHDDLVPPAYPCGNGSCIHFGPEALREMGRRYYTALINAAQ